MGKQIRLEGNYLDISEADPLTFDFVNQFSQQGQCMAIGVRLMHVETSRNTLQ